MAKVKAIVRGPEDYFDGVLHPPGSIVEVDEEFVSDKDLIPTEVTVRLAQPISVDGKVQRTVTETIMKRVRFRPLGSVDKALDAAAPAAPAPDRVNITDFLKGGVADIVAKIESGSMDDFLDVIAGAESASKARKGVMDAVEARLNAA